ncbi:MAG: phage capsid protein [Alphaproteobacteria bacterium]|nr:phage capsid protein [Alphaproteobacteria bacterium]MDA7982711.1 phage capsid protein [Alphaproteobacteria bacterium]MDA7988265.1 phage capsid protein [Alphaproteobacteria bacterium]MDA8000046.1 phage capsid protein [Alphaproteobacteria bacterium]MDA8003989.1 phage capsid protein [Alphaproteobacteria bacterium]
MSTTIEKAFVRQFEAEVHLAYQRQGSKLRPTVRSKTGVRGSSTTFQRVGKGRAALKGRHGKIPVMNLEYSDPVECALQDWYAGEWIDRLDELKTNNEERQVVVNSAAYALGRKTDDLVIGALTGASGITTQTVATAAAFNMSAVLNVFEVLGGREVPDDGERFAIVGWKQWSKLLSLDEFSSADYVGEENLPFRDFQARRWLGTTWMPHSGLPVSASRRACFWYHRAAIGHAAGSEVATDISWHGDRAAHFVNSMMSQGVCVIDTDGVVRFDVAE